MKIKEDKDDETLEVKEYCASIKSLKQYFFKELLYEEYKIGDLPSYFIPADYQHVNSLKSEHRSYGEKRVLKVRIKMQFIYR